MTYLDLINKYEPILKQKNLSKNALLAIIYYCNKEITDMYTLTNHLNEEIQEDIYKQIKYYLDKYLNENIPLNYLLKQTDFFGLKFRIYENVLVPRNETEELVEAILYILRNSLDFFKKWKKPIKVLDLCCGTGIIGLTLKKEIPSLEVTLSDISKHAIHNTIENAKQINVNVNVILSDLFQNIHDKFNVIVFNPPYVAYNDEVEDSVLKYDPYNALYAPNNGLYYYEKILSQIQQYLEPSYLIGIEIGENQAKAVSALVEKYLGIIPKVLKDSFNQDRIIIINRLV